MKVTLIARTAFNSEIAHDLTDGWEGTSQDTDGALLSEFAGRACYQSWNKPNPATAENQDYIAHIIKVKHESVLEHGSMTFYIEDVSRSLTHELIRHRHLSPSQESQRFVRFQLNMDPVIPPLYRHGATSETMALLDEVWSTSIRAYDALVSIWEQRLLRESGAERLSTHMAKKAREAARCVLPNMTPTRIVMTGNHRAWRHFLTMRGALGADAEIREVAIEIYRWARSVEPAMYQDAILKVDDREGEYLEFISS